MYISSFRGFQLFTVGHQTSRHHQAAAPAHHRSTRPRLRRHRTCQLLPPDRLAQSLLPRPTGPAPRTPPPLCLKLLKSLFALAAGRGTRSEPTRAACWRSASRRRNAAPNRYCCSCRRCRCGLRMPCCRHDARAGARTSSTGRCSSRTTVVVCWARRPSRAGGCRGLAGPRGPRVRVRGRMLGLGRLLPVDVGRARRFRRGRGTTARSGGRAGGAGRGGAGLRVIRGTARDRPRRNATGSIERAPVARRPPAPCTDCSSARPHSCRSCRWRNCDRSRWPWSRTVPPAVAVVRSGSPNTPCCRTARTRWRWPSRSRDSPRSRPGGNRGRRPMPYTADAVATPMAKPKVIPTAGIVDGLRHHAVGDRRRIP